MPAPKPRVLLNSRLAAEIYAEKLAIIAPTSFESCLKSLRVVLKGKSVAVSEVHTDSAAAILSASASNAWWTADSPPTGAAAASAHIHANAGNPNPSLHTRPDPPRYPHHPPCWPPPGPTGPTCLVDADSELARALAADPFHLDWPHW
jgi:hypothetical protein